LIEYNIDRRVKGCVYNQVLLGYTWHNSDKTLWLQNVRDDIPNMELKIMIRMSQWLLQ